MLVSELMTTEPLACAAEQTLADALKVMWEKDCGCVPVVDLLNRPVGIVTDRDAAIAVWSQDRPPSAIALFNFVRPGLVTCTPETKIKRVLKLMRKHKLRRIPVVDDNEKLVGMISVADIVRATFAESEITKTIRAISA